MDYNSSRSARACPTSISNRVATEVADTLNVDPLEIDPLYENIDPDALDGLFQTSARPHSDSYVGFTMEGCTVAVYGSGRIEVAPPDEALDNTENGGSMSAGNF